MLGSQSQNIWSDIMGQAANPKPKRRDEWEDDVGKDAATKGQKVGPKGRRQAEDAEPSTTGILAVAVCYVHGFKDKQVCLIHTKLYLKQKKERVLISFTPA
jgi:DNA replication regulator DPB11